MKLNNGKKFPAKVVRTDIKRVAKLRESEKNRTGEIVITIGNALGLERSVLKGIISSK